MIRSSVGHISSACKTYPSSIPFPPPLPLTLWTKPPPSSSAPLWWPRDCCPCFQAPGCSPRRVVFLKHTTSHPKAAFRIKSVVLTIAHRPSVTQPLTDSSALPPTFLLLHPPTQVFLFSDTPGSSPSRDCRTCPALIGVAPRPQHTKVSACWLQSLIECPLYRETFPAHLIGKSPSRFLPVIP